MMTGHFDIMYESGVSHIHTATALFTYDSTHPAPRWEHIRTLACSISRWRCAFGAWAAGGVFTHRDALGWQPGVAQMNKQGNWWLHALVQYDYNGEVLHMHRVTGEISIERGTPAVSVRDL